MTKDKIKFLAEIVKNERIGTVVYVSKFNGNNYLNVRDYFMKDGVKTLTSKGVAIPISSEWDAETPEVQAVVQAIQNLGETLKKQGQ